jgi:hypothetical protein
MTPLTITVSIWNHCQYRCEYCVSRSNDPRWDPPKSWDEVKPGDLLDVGALDRWLSTFTPGARLHISGGEPLLRPDCEDAIELLARKHETRIYSNGALIRERPKLLELPLSWIVSWHPTQVSLDRFVRQVAPLEGHPVVGRVVLRDGDDPSLADRLRGRIPWALVVHPQWDRDPNRTWRGFGPDQNDDIDHVASERIHLIIPRNGGEVWPCNSCAAACGPIGNIETGWYRPELAVAMDIRARECVISNKCAAYQDAVLLNLWFGKEEIS